MDQTPLSPVPRTGQMKMMERKSQCRGATTRGGSRKRCIFVGLHSLAAGSKRRRLLIRRPHSLRGVGDRVTDILNLQVRIFCMLCNFAQRSREDNV